MSFALNLLYDACVPSIQSCSITNEEPIANPITQLIEQSSSQEEENSSDNVEQAREVESIDQALIDNQISFSLKHCIFSLRTIWKNIHYWLKVNILILLTHALINI